MKTILIVEDIDLNADLLSQLLEDDYNLLIAKDGQQGVAASRAAWTGPGADGYFPACNGWL